MCSNISSKADYYRNPRSSMDKHDDGDDFSNFHKLVEEAKEHESEKKSFLKFIFYKSKKEAN